MARQSGFPVVRSALRAPTAVDFWICLPAAATTPANCRHVPSKDSPKDPSPFVCSRTRSSRSPRGWRSPSFRHYLFGRAEGQHGLPTGFSDAPVHWWLRGLTLAASLVSVPTALENRQRPLRAKHANPGRRSSIMNDPFDGGCTSRHLRLQPLYHQGKAWPSGYRPPST